MRTAMVIAAVIAFLAIMPAAVPASRTISGHSASCSEPADAPEPVILPSQPAQAGIVTTKPAVGCRGNPVNLIAYPDAGYSFDYWSGDICNGSRSTTCSTHFKFGTQPSLSANFCAVASSGTAGPVVDVSPFPAAGSVSVATIGSCVGDSVTLSAASSLGYVFGDWSGDVCNGETSPTCSTTIQSTRQHVTAHFAASQSPAGANCGPTSSQPWSNGTACTITATPVDANTIRYRIDSPVVDRSSYDYTPITFQSGDSIRVRAGGCVQTGGSGPTWKRYVDPTGDNAGDGVDTSGFYHGTITISLAKGVGGQPVLNEPILKAVRDTQTTPFVVVTPPPPVTAPVPLLTLGYVDDNYGDNGYWGHDGDYGNPVQCLPSEDGGNAWVELTVTHGNAAPPPPQQLFKAFDEVPSGAQHDATDPNLIPADPSWGWQIPGTPTQGAPLGSYTKQCDVPISTILGPYYEPPGVEPAPSRCTRQVTNVNLPPDPSFFSDPWRSIKNFFGLCDAGGQFSINSEPVGHTNWGEATYTDPSITWNTWDDPNPPYGNPPFGGDDDYNMNIVTPLAPDQTSHAGTTSVNPDSIGIEFDSDETIDHYDANAWWKAFHIAVKESQDAALPQLVLAGKKFLEDNVGYHNVNYHEAVVTGVLGLDGTHGGSEIHPVHVLAIRLAAPLHVDANNDHWAFFVRNSGDEGECSTLQENLDLRQITLRLPPPMMQAVSRATYSANTVQQNAPDPPAFASDSSGAYLTFKLPPPDQHGYVAGDICVHWIPPGGGTFPGSPPVDCTSPTSSLRSATSRYHASSAPDPGGVPEKRLGEAVRKLSRNQRRIFATLLTPFASATPAARPTAVTVVTARQRPAPPASPPQLETTYDPEHVAGVANRVLALLVAQHGVYSHGRIYVSITANPGIKPNLLHPRRCFLPVYTPGNGNPGVMTAPGTPSGWNAISGGPIRNRLIDVAKVAKFRTIEKWLPRPNGLVTLCRAKDIGKVPPLSPFTTHTPR